MRGVFNKLFSVIKSSARNERPSQKTACRSFDKLTKARKSSRLLCTYCYRVETPLLHGLAGLFCCWARRPVGAPRCALASRLQCTALHANDTWYMPFTCSFSEANCLFHRTLPYVEKCNYEFILTLTHSGLYNFERSYFYLNSFRNIKQIVCCVKELWELYNIPYRLFKANIASAPISESP